ncbi:glycosyltransferase family 2 protein [Hymenobacter sp. BT770]|uniref:glycosyltransferase family 2 protein n=1 Tax=Hymenobacter sp. BT770 TaxID=2886942 RepID=UPI001D12824E|nr:glycosyltransferase family 2 protein [Hymenobacter sp. BT770]MCC3155134.1 glycosyltransferase family 2 protein [Hymenobacter sp. BT770]MDO3417143.1 glycosyltransferase family 2 protein [Hymenobacter sp. BT770]
MLVLEYLFWLALATVVYTYVGYAVVVGLLAALVRRLRPPRPLLPFEPAVTLVVPAYNEARILAAKVENCLAQDYPTELLQLVVITDGSTDNSAQVLARYPRVRHLHSPVRGGKSLAENRAMEFVHTPFVVFTDANTDLNPRAVRELVQHYQNPQVGAVSGEKKVRPLAGSTPGAGEGLYWKYESFLKRCDSCVYSLMGAAGELVSFRSHLFRPLEADTILDDFVQSLRLVEQGYTVVYEPRAYATEDPSPTLADEWERKIRICAGGWQAMGRLRALLNPVRRPLATFLYVSHRVLRWSAAPVALALLLPLSAVLAATASSGRAGFYGLATAAQVLFYLAAWRGWQGASGKLTVVPLYFCLMNLAVFAGFRRYYRKAQPAAWAKAARPQEPQLAAE